MIDVYGKDKLLPAITFEQACEVIRKKGRGDLLGGMEKMKAAYYDAETLGHYSHVVCPDNWMEFNAEETQAYNMVFEGFAELFNERKSDLNHLEKLAADFHRDSHAQDTPIRWHEEDDCGVSNADRYLEELDYE
jgi:hypothetical protein